MEIVYPTDEVLEAERQTTIADTLTETFYVLAQPQRRDRREREFATVGDVGVCAYPSGGLHATFAD